MDRRKGPAIPDEMLDQLLSGASARTAFDQGGLQDQLKNALAERALNPRWSVSAATGPVFRRGG
jgi:putative transposase